MFNNIDKMKDFSVGNISIKFRDYAQKVRERLEVYEKTDIATRIFRREAEIWIPDRTKAGSTPELVNRLGWLDAPKEAQNNLKNLAEFSEGVRKEGFADVVLLGMGGSSLAPEVFMKTFGNSKGFPKLTVLDTTHPETVKAVSDRLNFEKTLFIVSSKSGSTLETASLFKYFWEETRIRKSDPGKYFVAITDKGSAFDKQARELNFRKVFNPDPDIGGRFSALTYFGLVPASLIDAPVASIINRAFKIMEESRISYPISQNSSAVLGTAMGEFASRGRDKFTFLLSRSIGSFGNWLEQLIAESTGKLGKGILPVIDEPVLKPDQYGRDRVFVYINLINEKDGQLEDCFKSLESSDHPTIRIDLGSKEDLGGEFYRWEFATAVAGAILGLNPFNQPDVESTKLKTGEVMKSFETTGRLSGDKPLLTDSGFDLYSDESLDGRNLKEKIESFFKKREAGGYCALMAYLPYNKSYDQALGTLREKILRKYGLPVTLGFGPRFLHSTGQLHKGDSNRGLFIQITSDIKTDINVPNEKYSFGTLISAQAQGDYRALREKKRRVARIHLKGSTIEGLNHLERAFSRETWNF